MNQTSPHPDESQLRGLLRGTLASADEAAVLAQLEREPAWQAALDRLVADEATWRAAAESLQKPPLAADRTLRSVLASLASIDRSHSSINTPTTGETLDSSASDADHSRDLRFLAPSDDPTYLGKLGPYLVEEVIGRGGFGVVLKARDPKLARIVAIKVLAPHLATSGTACQRFRREALSAAAVAHEHVITIYAVDDAPLPHLVMQYVAGQSLQDKLDREGPLGVKETLRIGMQTAAGLAAAHKQGLVHRDIKPANILLENGIERVKLTDFGLARAADDASLTRSGTIAGTPQYMSPEQARGETVDAKSDLFSLGTVLYAMLTGRSPFRADSTLAVLKCVCDDPPRPIREVNPEVPDWLAALIDRLLAKAPSDRPASAQDVADQLGQYLLQVQQPRPAGHAPREPAPASKVVHAPAPAAPATPISADVRQRIDWIAYAHLCMIGLSAIGVVAAVLTFLAVINNRRSMDAGLFWFVVAWILGLSFPIPLITALLTLRRASYGVLMTGTLLTLFTAGLFNVFCWPISMGLMIWVLVQLQRDDVRAGLAEGWRSGGGSLPQAESTPLQTAAQAKYEPATELDLDDARRLVQPMGFALLAVAAFQLAAAPALFGWLAFMWPQRPPPDEILAPTVILIWTLALSSFVPLVGGILCLRLGWYRAAVGCAWISLLMALLNVPAWPVAVGLAGWALWWLRKPAARDAFALAEPPRLTADERLEVRWIRLQTRPIGMALLAIAGLCWLGMIGLIGFLNLFMHSNQPPRNEVLIPIVSLFWLLGAFSIVPLATGVLALRRGAYHAVSGGAWLSLVPALANVPCWPISVGLALWVLLQMRRDEVRQALGSARPRSVFAPAANSALPPVRTAAGFSNSDSLPIGNTPMLAKPAKLDPFVDAPPVPRRSRVATVLLGLGLLLAGVMALACVGLVGSYVLHHRPSPQTVLQNSRQLTVNIPDRRLTATLRLQRAQYNGGYPMPGVAIPDLNHTLQLGTGETYRLMAGQYELTVKSDDVTVLSDAIHIQPDPFETKIYEVKPGGILNLEVQPVQFDHLCVDVNGHPFIKDATQKSQRMLVVPEGAMRIKTYATHSNHVYAEKWLELKAGEEITVRVSRESIEIISPAAAKPAGAATRAGSGG